jgi:CheY-like chemotaxis protein
MRIAENRWEGVMLARLVEDQLSIARPAGAGGWSMAGADVVVSPQIGLALSLALHELAGNAIQHGALSGPDGRVEVAWTVEERADGDRLRFTWTESGGPPVGAPGPAGFGRTLIERSLAHDIGGAVELDFRPEGLVCRIEMPLSARTPATGQGEAPQASGQRVLVVEDNALVALEVETILADAGHTVVGPAGRVSEALDLVERGSFDIALLDVDLHGDRVWPVADALAARGVPFAFTTGFRGEIIMPERFSSVEFLGKPYREADLLALTRRLLARVAPPRA